MPDCAVIVLSFDKYSDLWGPCLRLYDRYWPDRRYPLYLVTEEEEGPAGSLAIRVGKGLDWSTCVLRAIAQIDQSCVLLMLDDFFLTGPVDSRDIQRSLEEMESLNAGYARLVPRPPPTAVHHRSVRYGIHELGAAYRTSLQAAFWRKEVLLGCLREGESPWQFEVAGSERSAQRSEAFLSAHQALIPYVDVLERGRWLPRGLALCEREGIPVDRARREAIGVRDHARRALIGAVSRGCALIPWRVRRHVNGLVRSLRTWRDS